jgi:hypothetical protein
MKEGEFAYSSSGAGTEFIRAELLSGLTRARIAQNALDEQKRSRNRSEARKAYDAILRFLPQTLISEDEKGEIDSRIAELRFVLHSLGEDCQ